MYLEGGGLVGLHKLSPGGLHHQLLPLGGDPDTGRHLVIGRFSGDLSLQHALGVNEVSSCTV